MPKKKEKRIRFDLEPGSEEWFFHRFMKDCDWVEIEPDGDWGFRLKHTLSGTTFCNLLRSTNRLGAAYVHNGKIYVLVFK